LQFRSDPKSRRASRETKRSDDQVIVDGTVLTLLEVVAVARNHARVEISQQAREAVRKGREAVERILKSGKSAYGINTGFGKFADVKIGSQRLEELQFNLLRSHSVGTGEPISEEDARAMMLVRLNSLLRGNSGVRLQVVQILQEFLNKGIYPFIPRYGSLGASGDLAPSAHLGLCMIGEGMVIDEKGNGIDTARVFKTKRIRPITLKAKEGLAIINGTQMMTAIGSLAVSDAISLLKNLDIAAALSLEALGASLSPFDSKVQYLRPMHGQAHVAARVQRLCRDSRLMGSTKNLQDPYSLRCIPQVHGALYDALQYARKVLEIELNSVTDNPIIFPESNEVVSAGNFHGQPVAIALDLLSLVLAEASIFSERRIDKLLSAHNPKLPLFLTREPGLDSGFMVTQYTAASLVAENRILGVPAGLSSASVSAGQEDHASMGVTAALKAKNALDHATKIIGIEMLCSCQAIDILCEDLKSDPNDLLGQGTKIAYTVIRDISDKLTDDRSLHADIEKTAQALTEDLISKEIERSIQL
jgi:histidine ammonia-lyase